MWLKSSSIESKLRHWRSRTRWQPYNPGRDQNEEDAPPSEEVSSMGGEEEKEGRNWENLPPDLLLEIIKRAEASGRQDSNLVVFCASVCRTWRKASKDLWKTPEECGRLTFTVSLKQPGPRRSPIRCFVKRDKTSSTYYLCLGLTPPAAAERENKFLLAARQIKRATCTEFVISFSPHDFSKASNNYVGNMRSNFLGTNFTIYDSIAQPNGGKSRPIFHLKKKESPGLPIGTVSYKNGVGPRRMQCEMNDTVLISSDASEGTMQQTWTFKNVPPAWHIQCMHWNLNFNGRVTCASVKNFQLVVVVAERQVEVLQFGKTGKDLFTMDYRYPLSAFKAFAICLTSFGSKLRCE